MDGAVVGLDGFFDVSGESAEFPGDPALSASESINCRCAVEWVLAEEVGSEAVLSYLRRALKRPVAVGATNGKAR